MGPKKRTTFHISSSFCNLPFSFHFDASTLISYVGKDNLKREMTIYTLGDYGGGHAPKKVCTQLASSTPCMFVTMLGRSIELS